MRINMSKKPGCVLLHRGAVGGAAFAAASLIFLGAAVAEEPFHYETLPPVICKLQPYNDDGSGGGILCTINGVPVGAITAQPCREKKGRLVDQGNGKFACRIPVAVNTTPGTPTKR
jgi:hypothetical protein